MVLIYNLRPYGLFFIKNQLGFELAYVIKTFIKFKQQFI